MSQQKLIFWHNLCSGSFEGFDFIHFITQPNFNLQNNSSRLLNLLVDESQDGTIHFKGGSVKLQSQLKVFKTFKCGTRRQCCNLNDSDIAMNLQNFFFVV